jgi:hypothetical protein
MMTMHDTKTKWEIEAEEFRRRHQERLAARDQECRFSGVLKSAYDKIPINKLIGNIKTSKPDKNEDDQ